MCPRALLQRLWLSFIFYFFISKKEIKRRLFNFIVGVSSVLITVFVAATVSTVVDYAPFVMLKQAENSCGQFDFQLSARTNRGPYMNYSLAVDTLNANDLSDIAQLSSPRYVFNSTQSQWYSPKCVQTIPNFSVQSADITDLFDTDQCRIKFSGSKCKQHSSTLWVIDFERERSMGFGDQFPRDLVPQKGEIIVNKKQTKALGINLNDYLLLYLDLDNGAEQNLLSSVAGDAPYTRSSSCSKVLLPVRVTGIVDEIAYSKFGIDDNQFTFIMSHTQFVQHLDDYTVGDGQHYEYKKRALQTLLAHPSRFLHELSSHIFYMIPHRIDMYLTLDYQHIQREFAKYASHILYMLGFDRLSIESPIISKFEQQKFASLFFDLILELILFILIILSVMLLYSLLTISVDTRTFELGILRMIGFSKRNLIKLLINESLSYSVPALVFGLLLSELSIFYLLRTFSHLIGYQITPIISLNGWLRAIFVGLIIPLIAMVLPIKNALNTNLHDAIDNNKHGQALSMIQYKIKKSSSSPNSCWSVSPTVLIIGIVFVVFGGGVYYVFPLSLITQHLSLLLICFFALLCAMLAGLSLLAFNVHHLLQKLIIALLLSWWEKPSLLHVLAKNIISHKVRNQKTYCMYSLSLGFILMIVVVYQLQIQSVAMAVLARVGGTYFVAFPSDETWRYREMEEKFAPHIMQDMAFKFHTESIHGVSDFSMILKGAAGISAVSPNYLNVAESKLFSFDYTADAGNYARDHRIDEVLYTAMGSQHVAAGFSLQSMLNIEPNSKHKALIVNNTMIVNVLATINVFAGYRELSKLWLRPYGSMAMSIPSMLRFAVAESKSASLEDIIFAEKGVLLKFAENASVSDIAAVKQYANEHASRTFDFEDFAAIIETTNGIMDIVFSVATYIALFLCLFSVISSMYINVYEQSKEIVILRSIGINKFQTMKIYLYEATVLILSSCLMGICIGCMVGFTMSAQMALYASYPISFDLSYVLKLSLNIFIASYISAFLSIILPLTQLLSQTIAHIMRLSL